MINGLLLVSSISTVLLSNYLELNFVQFLNIFTPILSMEYLLFLVYYYYLSRGTYEANH